MAREAALPLELEEEQGEPRRRRGRRLLQTARRHPLGVFGLICISLLFFCGIFAEFTLPGGFGLSITPYDPIAVIRERLTFGELAQPIDEDDTALLVSNAQLEGQTNFDIEGERMSVLWTGAAVEVSRGPAPTAHEAGVPLLLETAGSARLVQPIDQRQTRIIITDSGTGLAPGANFFIDSESVTVTRVVGPADGGTEVEVSRGSSPAPHEAGAPVLSETDTLPTLGEAIDTQETTLFVANQQLDEGSTFDLEGEEITVLSVLDGSAVGVQRSSAPPAHAAGAVLELDTAIPTQSPSWSHPFGTDHNSRDVLSRTIFGARISLLIGLTAVITGVSTGALLGIISGYFGRAIDTTIQRGVDILLAFPAVVFLLAIITVIGDEDSTVRRFLANNTPLPDRDFIGIPNFLDVFIVSLAIGLAVAVFTTRVVRGAVLSIKENVYVDAARAMGASDSRIMMKHIFPNVIALVVILGSVLLPVAILAEATISFLGIGVPIPTPSWGADLSDEKSRQLMLEGYWWPVFFPGLALCLVVLGFNMLGDAFRDLSDPRLRGSGLGGGSGGGGGGGGGGGAI
jgi:peptide/nickel transport system permease protein